MYKKGDRVRFIGQDRELQGKIGVVHSPFALYSFIDWDDHTYGYVYNSALGPEFDVQKIVGKKDYKILKALNRPQSKNKPKPKSKK